MTSRFPSIQSFYSRETASDGPQNPSTVTKAGDGFTSAEVDAVVNPLSRSFRPSRHYDTCPIAEIQTGPCSYKISGRLVNFSSTGGPQGTPADAGGYFFLVICDGTAAIAVKLFCNQSEYHPLLGQRITVWATAISAGNQAEIGHIPHCSIATTIYPGRNGATHIEFHVDQPGSEEDCLLRSPLELDIEKYEHLPGLMTLKSFLASGYDLGEGKILVCVRSVGPRRTIYSKKKESNFDLVEVGIYDDTAHCVLKLWGDKIPSAKSWAPNQTILLISQPSCYAYDRTNRQDAVHAEVSIGYSSIVDVDPNFAEAKWLRTKIQDMAKRDRVIVPFPIDTWDIQLAMHGPGRTLYTLAEVEEQVRNPDPAANFTGKLSVVILDMNLMNNWRKATMCCTECCGIPLYSNRPTATCKNCDSQQTLSVNPRVLGSFLDESGQVSGHKLIWNNEAWTQLLFGEPMDESPKTQALDNATKRSWQDITTFDANTLRDLEAKLLYSRVALTFGWSIELGRLCILGVEW